MLLSFLLFSWAHAFAAEPTITQNVPEPLAALVRQDMAFLAGVRIRGALPIYQELFGGADGQAAMNYFTSQVRYISLSKCGDDLNQEDIDRERQRQGLPPLTEDQRVHIVACAEPIFATSTMWVTSYYQSWAGLQPQVLRSMILLHERRHLEFQPHSGWEHTNCPVDFKNDDGTPSKLAGGPYCDAETYGLRGSYGVGAAFMETVAAYCSNCTEKVKEDARLYSRPLFSRILSVEGRARLQREITEAANPERAGSSRLRRQRGR